MRYIRDYIPIIIIEKYLYLSPQAITKLILISESVDRSHQRTWRHHLESFPIKNCLSFALLKMTSKYLLCTWQDYSLVNQRVKTPFWVCTGAVSLHCTLHSRHIELGNASSVLGARSITQKINWTGAICLQKGVCTPWLLELVNLLDPIMSEYFAGNVKTAK